MKRIGWIFACLALLAVGVSLQVIASRYHPVISGPSVAEGAFSALGGLRSIAAEIVWFRADRLQEEGRYVELAQLAQTLAMSEPHTPEVWSYAAWNLAYNVSVMMPSADDRWRWVAAALSLLRDQGLAFNPRSGELHRELAWLFELKLALDIDSAAWRYREKWREIVTDVERRGAWGELKMDPKVMAALEMNFELADRGDPLYSAVYWAYVGLRYADSRERAFLEEILRQSLVIYARKHAGVGSNG